MSTDLWGNWISSYIYIRDVILLRFLFFIFAILQRCRCLPRDGFNSFFSTAQRKFLKIILRWQACWIWAKFQIIINIICCFSFARIETFLFLLNVFRYFIFGFFFFFLPISQEQKRWAGSVIRATRWTTIEIWKVRFFIFFPHPTFSSSKAKRWSASPFVSKHFFLFLRAKS